MPDDVRVFIDGGTDFTGSLPHTKHRFLFDAGHVSPHRASCISGRQEHDADRDCPKNYALGTTRETTTVPHRPFQDTHVSWAQAPAVAVSPVAESSYLEATGARVQPNCGAGSGHGRPQLITSRSSARRPSAVTHSRTGGASRGATRSGVRPSIVLTRSIPISSAVVW